MLTAQTLLEFWRHRLAVPAAQLRQHLRKASIDRGQRQAAAGQEPLDAVRVLRALRFQLQQVAVQLPPVLVRDARRLHDTPHVLFPLVPADQHAQ